MEYYKYKDKENLFKYISPYFNVNVFDDYNLYKMLGILCITQDSYKLKFQNGFFKIFGVKEYDSSNFDFHNLIDEISKNIINYKDTDKKLKGIIENLKNFKTKIAFINNVFYDTGDLIKCLEVYFVSTEINEEQSLLIVVKNDNIIIEDKLELIELNNQKSILLKEVHHRVKNNLQILNSLINIQQRFQFSDSEIIHSMKVYISSMAIIHEKLYSEDKFDYVLLNEFFIKFKNNLLDLYSNMGINFVFDLKEDLYLNVNIMMPFSLILNELIINSIKYAFPDGFEGKKEIVCSIKSDDNLCKVHYFDNGVGLSNDLDKDSLGKILVDSLVGQIDGDFTICNSNKGFECYIEFPMIDV